MGITELCWWVPFNSAEKGFPMCYYERANMLCKCWILWRGANVCSRNGGPGSSFVIQHFLRSMQQHIIFKLHPLAMWISLSSPRCFANIYVFGQATNSICAQLNPHKNSVFDRRLFFSFPSSEKCQTRLFSLWVGNVPFRVTHNDVANTLPWGSILVTPPNFGTAKVTWSWNRSS